VDPGRDAFEARVDQEIKRAGLDPRIRRAFCARVDLNGDGTPDGVALVWAPGWSDASGGTLLVFRGERSGYRLVSRTRPVRLPVCVAADRSAGWLDLLTPTGGGGQPGGMISLRYDGAAYPSEASALDILPEIPEGLTRILP
jgi:hypothetical protein